MSTPHECARLVDPTTAIVMIVIIIIIITTRRGETKWLLVLVNTHTPNLEEDQSKHNSDTVHTVGLTPAEELKGSTTYSWKS